MAEQAAAGLGRDRIGVGLFKVLRKKRGIAFSDEPSSDEGAPAKSGYLAMCEQGEPLVDVIAANYTLALRQEILAHAAHRRGRLAVQYKSL